MLGELSRGFVNRMLLSGLAPVLFARRLALLSSMFARAGDLSFEEKVGLFSGARRREDERPLLVPKWLDSCTCLIPEMS